jgi:hypothetical protein
MTIETSTITLPSYWACALINGDYSGLEDDECRRCDAAIAELSVDGWEIIDTVENEEPRFTWYYHLYDPGAGVSGGDVIDYVILRNQR